MTAAGPGFRLVAKACNECLFSPNRIVRPGRVRDIVRKCLKTETHFVCHKTMDNPACCRGFYDRFHDRIWYFRLARLWNMIELVPLDEKEEP